MTAADVRPEILRAAFDFARAQDDPRFRRFLAKIGWADAAAVVVCLDDDPVTSVVRRIANNSVPSPCRDP